VKPLQLQSIRREAGAIAKQAYLLASHRRTEQPVDAAERVIVLVHGFMAGAGVLRPLAEHLARTLEEPVLVFGYGSHRRFDTVEDQFERFVDDLAPASARLALVGHSLGGLVCRSYAQERDASARVERLVTIACPHDGTRVASVVPVPLGRALLPQSEPLRRLERNAMRLDRLAPTLVLAEHDAVVPDGARTPGFVPGEVHVVRGATHNAVLYDPHTHALVTRALRRTK